MNIAAIVRNSYQHHEVIVQTNESARKMAIEPKSSGYGSSVNGGELLLVALATCYCNDIYREAAKRDIRVESVEVECNAVFGGPGEPGTAFTYTVNIKADAPQEIINTLISETDHVAEIHNTLRKGVNVKLVS